jgi:endonuclease YncB( thermonuclease family)
MLCPPHGISLPCTLDRVIDGDTVDVRCLDRTWRIRLLDCWAPEIHGEQKPAGLKSKAFLERLLSGGETLTLFVPLAPGGKISKLLTCDRVLGRIFVGAQDAAEVLRRHGLATETKAD